ncbi:DsbE family thiol:disulfide interchange protein [Magnetofaba australis]|uniref:Putative periplasmic protein thiol--disulfide oxidoreductase DsbE n=1 Tax=Magnetofaba australis IT-1 TaxID=1434232 RepID=A0A1Y2K359_9PROT|nr:DsbE family thiol:disulfide interchange protein [Magnetofaba australis]OSM01475.1 putative periplasmic protein thiol--disulfide oxidoreductase DsbE [Magnetofaba australis IT-1]
MNGFLKFALLGVIVGILGLMALGLGQDHKTIPSPLVNKPALPVAGETLTGKQVDMQADYLQQGKWTLLNFWGSWCGSCVAEHPYLISLARQTKDRADFVMLGVDFKDSEGRAKRFLSRHGDPGYEHVQDPKQKIAIDWGVTGAPESFLISPQGVICLKHIGPLYQGWFEKVAEPHIQSGACLQGEAKRS